MRRLGCIAYAAELSVGRRDEPVYRLPDFRTFILPSTRSAIKTFALVSMKVNLICNVRRQLFVIQFRQFFVIHHTMVSKAVALLLSDLGITKSLSRPHVSNDNPYSEAHFKTLKYRPGFPKNFGSIEDARLFCEGFFQWYNYEHYHSGIAFLTPDTVHQGRAEACLKARQTVMNKAFEEHPDRFNRRPKVLQLPKEVWINKPQKSAAEVVPLATTYGGVPVSV